MQAIPILISTVELAPDTDFFLLKGYRQPFGIFL
jgi:hypothetical protein